MYKSPRHTKRLKLEISKPLLKDCIHSLMMSKSKLCQISTIKEKMITVSLLIGK